MSETPYDEVYVPLEKRKIIKSILERKGIDCSNIEELDKLVILLDDIAYLKQYIKTQDLL